MAFSIEKVIAEEILDSRGNPTVECTVFTKTSKGTDAVPSGASIGKFEAKELRDGGKRYGGLGVRKAVENVKKIALKIKGMDCRKQGEIDRLMIDLDGTCDKSKLGANAILSVSLATARAAANTARVPLYKYLANFTKSKKFILPIPFSNVVNGGRHAANNLKFQEFMLVSNKFSSFASAIEAEAEIYHELKKMIIKKYGKQSANVGDEGGFAPNIETPEEVLNLLEKAVEETGYKRKVSFAIDAAASEFYNEKKQKYSLEKSYSTSELLDYYLQLVKSYPIVSIEDPFEQGDFDSCSELTKKAGIQIVGDDLLVTNVCRIKTAIRKKACNCLLLKVNQIGTLTEAICAAQLALKNKWKVMVSHRSGETSDSFIADLAVALSCGQIKAGAPDRSDRVAKYNQLLRIEEELGSKAVYARNVF